MDKRRIIRAWKDPEYRASLTAEQRAALPECPSGPPLTELDETELLGIVGGCYAQTREENSCLGLCATGNICTEGGANLSW